MAKFLHEYKIINGNKVDNGYWEIEGDRLHNRMGGCHTYHPSPEDEIIEAEWKDVIRLTIRDDSKTTGWIAPDGTFYGCAPQDHMELAEYVLDSDELELEKKGFVKIYENPIMLRIEDPDLPTYDYFINYGKHMTSAQQEVLKKKGLVVKRGLNEDRRNEEVKSKAAPL